MRAGQSRLRDLPAPNLNDYKETAKTTEAGAACLGPGGVGLSRGLRHDGHEHTDANSAAHTKPCRGPPNTLRYPSSQNPGADTLPKSGALP